MNLKQYQIVLVNLDPTIGSKIKKTRPCVIISPDEMNTNLNTVIITPITHSSKLYPTRINLKGNSVKGWIVIDQIKTIDKSRIVKVIEFLAQNEIALIKSVIKETFVD